MLTSCVLSYNVLLYMSIIDMLVSTSAGRSGAADRRGC